MSPTYKIKILCFSLHSFTNLLDWLCFISGLKKPGEAAPPGVSAATRQYSSFWEHPGLLGTTPGYKGPAWRSTLTHACKGRSKQVPISTAHKSTHCQAKQPSDPPPAWVIAGDLSNTCRTPTEHLENTPRDSGRLECWWAPCSNIFLFGEARGEFLQLTVYWSWFTWAKISLQGILSIPRVHDLSWEGDHGAQKQNEGSFWPQLRLFYSCKAPLTPAMLAQARGNSSLSCCVWLFPTCIFSCFFLFPHLFSQERFAGLSVDAHCSHFFPVSHVITNLIKYRKQLHRTHPVRLMTQICAIKHYKNKYFYQAPSKLQNIQETFHSTQYT